MKIGVVSPSAPVVHKKTRKKHFEKGLSILEELGAEVFLSENCKNFLNYVSATTKDRVEDLEEMYKREELDAIVASNGGWNSSDILNDIDFELIKESNTPLVGFSDITVLLNSFYTKTKNIQFHGPMVAWGFSKNDSLTNDSFQKAINRENQKFLIKNFGKTIKDGNFQGTLVGGNLISLSNLLGTPYEPDWNNKILFWEEVGEEVFRLDRTLTHFKNAEVWDKIEGMIIGNLSRIDEQFEGKRVRPMDMIKDHFEEYDFPMLKTNLFGHGVNSIISIPIGGSIDFSDNNLTIAYD